MTKARFRQPLVLVLLVAFAARLIWALLVPVVPQSDALMYDGFAREILAGHGYVFPGGGPTAYWPVGASALYAVAYWLFGAGGLGIAIFNIAMGTALAAASYGLARLRFGPRVGLIAGLIFAFWPAWIQFTTVLNSELPCALLLMLALLIRGSGGGAAPAEAAGGGASSRWLPRTIFSAVCLVGSAYMRPIVMPLFIALPILDWIRHRDGKRALVDLVAMLVVAAALIGPWALRNKALFGHAAPISTNFGANLWMGNNPASNGGYMPLPSIGLHNEVARDRYFKKSATDFITAHPGRYVALSAARVKLSLDRESIGVTWNADGLWPELVMPLKALSTLYWLAALLAGLAGFFLLLRASWLILFDPITISIGLVFATAILVVGGDRYHLPADPFIAIFAAVALARLLPARARATA